VQQVKPDKVGDGGTEGKAATFEPIFDTELRIGIGPFAEFGYEAGFSASIEMPS
jgi:hypothetical protein